MAYKQTNSSAGASGSGAWRSACKPLAEGPSTKTAMREMRIIICAMHDVTSLGIRRMLERKAAERQLSTKISVAKSASEIRQLVSGSGCDLLVLSEKGHSVIPEIRSASPKTVIAGPNMSGVSRKFDFAYGFMDAGISLGEAVSETCRRIEQRK